MTILKTAARETRRGAAQLCLVTEIPPESPILCEQKSYPVCRAIFGR